ncbi:DUF6686 family protein [Reichenbachiella sp. MALMAid0571]|uniref:DUF6686 family protein n=1 Tax=Reichenbachiella sp. MALMAid0571 TaxID=3143939 RepID=UPI0032DECD84
MKKCKPKILIEGEYFSISNCGCCKRVGFYYKNFLLGFTDEHFHLFCKSISRIDFETCASGVSGSSKQIVVNTCHQDIQLVFFQEEFYELKELTQQAKLVLDAYGVLNPHS